jgi:hypothetical protein
MMAQVMRGLGWAVQVEIPDRSRYFGEVRDWIWERGTEGEGRTETIWQVT